MKHVTLFFATFFILIAIVGCGDGRPKDMPKTFPCQIVIVKDGVPQEGYQVTLYPDPGNLLLSINATTDSSGVARVRTQMADYVAEGAPEGSYKVAVDKPAELPSDGVDSAQLSREDREAYYIKRAAEAEKFRIVPVRLTKANSTPFEMKLAKGSETRWTFDVKDYVK